MVGVTGIQNRNVDKISSLATKLERVMNSTEVAHQTIDRSYQRPILLGCGYFFFALGLIGAVLPILPTTVFWIVSAACFAKSSPRMYQRIVGWPGVGQVVEDFIAHGIIRRRSKVIAVSGMMVAAMIVALTPMGSTLILASIALIAMAGVYVWTRPDIPAMNN